MYVLGGLSTDVISVAKEVLSYAVRKVEKLRKLGQISDAQKQFGWAATGSMLIYIDKPEASDGIVRGMVEAIRNASSALGSSGITPTQYVSALDSIATGAGIGTRYDVPTTEQIIRPMREEKLPPGPTPPKPKPGEPPLPAPTEDKSNLMLIVAGGIAVFVAFSLLKK